MNISSEETFFEGGPAKGDLFLNLLASITIIGLPFTFAAIVRALWLRFTITNKRISITGGWLGRDKNQVSYNQIKEIRSVPRGFGSWGDMVIFLKDGSKLEIKSIPRFRDIEKYLLNRINAVKAKSTQQNVQGFAV